MVLFTIPTAGILMAVMKASCSTCATLKPRMLSMRALPAAKAMYPSPAGTLSMVKRVNTYLVLLPQAVPEYSLESWSASFSALIERVRSSVQFSRSGE